MKLEDGDVANKNGRRRKRSRSKLAARKPEAKDAADSEPASSDPAEANVIDNKIAPLKAPGKVSNGSQTGAKPMKRWH